MLLVLTIGVAVTDAAAQRTCGKNATISGHVYAVNPDGTERRVTGIGVRISQVNNQLNSSYTITDFANGTFTFTGLNPCTEYYVYHDRNQTVNGEFIVAGEFDPYVHLVNTAGNTGTAPPLDVRFRIFNP